MQIYWQKKKHTKAQDQVPSLVNGHSGIFASFSRFTINPGLFTQQPFSKLNLLHVFRFFCESFHGIVLVSSLPCRFGVKVTIFLFFFSGYPSSIQAETWGSDQTAGQLLQCYSTSEEETERAHCVTERVSIDWQFHCEDTGNFCAKPVHVLDSLNAPVNGLLVKANKGQAWP